MSRTFRVDNRKFKPHPQQWSIRDWYKDSKNSLQKCCFFRIHFILLFLWMCGHGGILWLADKTYFPLIKVALYKKPPPNRSCPPVAAIYSRVVYEDMPKYFLWQTLKRPSAYQNLVYFKTYSEDHFHILLLEKGPHFEDFKNSAILLLTPLISKVGTFF